ncbi:hypothetical protein CLV62_14416 [Dysgonomonas alginatilytica]|uniref:Uncharacterized protein n=1 Tax=Dysgonomonas alginatilytica TaxID=1605892 RepID=A0A2V3PHQ9_9BACT|nr:hypothetical protein [Dysgonomonas alginatilytica]PXV58804.1 hypothetical protein CLV62_14416 [Dysgonomonas alginatilytica]
MNNRINPFSDNRREREKDSVIILNYEDSIKWFSNSNYLFEGHRGSGKTSILTAYNYEFVWRKDSPIRPCKELENIYSNPNFIGVIYKCENQDKSTWQNWANINTQKNAQYLYTTYLNFFFAEKFIEAVLKIILSDDKYKEELSEEYLFINTVLDKAFPLIKNRPILFDYSLTSLKILFSDIHNSIRHSIIYEDSFNEIKNEICIHDNCSLIVEICKLIQKHFSSFKDILFFPLIDDVNRLTKWQLQCINSMLLNVENPISIKLSCVFGLYETKGSIDGRIIGNSDLSTIYLGYDNDITKISKQKDITPLLEEIFNIRVKSIYSNISHIDLEELFGKTPDLNNLLLETLATSQKTDVQELVDCYQKSGEKYFTDFWLDNENIRQPIKEKSSLNKLEKRQRDSSIYNKFRQTAIFTIIDHYNLGGKGFTYSSLDIIKHLICGSVRNFLKICELLWEDIENLIENDEITRQLDNDLQNKAIRKTAEHVFLGVDDRSLKEGSETTCRTICVRLSTLFKLFISKDSLKKTTECLSLRIKRSEQSDNIEDIIESIVLFEAFIKHEDKDDYLIGLHPILSPHFNLPYRSPFYYPHSVSSREFSDLIMGTDQEAKEAIETIFSKRIGIEKNQLTIFDDAEEMD